MAKIIVLGSFAGSLINFRGHLLKKMAENGHEVLACAPDASFEIQEKLKAIGVAYRDIPVDRTGLNPVRDIYTIFRLISLFREVKPDMVLGYTIKPVIYGSLAGRIAGVPRIFSMITGLGYAFSDGGLKEWLVGVVVRFLYKLGMGANRRVFFQNPDDRDIFIKQNLIHNFEQVALINGSGVDVDFFQFAPFPEKVSFLLIARLIKDKGILEYVKAARIVKGRYSQTIFRLVGWIDEGPQGISIADLDSWVKEGTVEYLGKLDDVRPAIAESSVYVLPSYHEGTPRTVLEAMAMGRPVITTDAPGCRETVEDGKNGFLVPVRDENTLADRMEYFIRHPELIARMGEESRRIALEKYDVHKIKGLPVLQNNLGSVDDTTCRIMLADARSYLPDDILVKVDRASMAASLEARVPFLDHELVAFVWTLPLNWKIRDGKGKWILRQILKRHVPETCFERPKTGFAVPIEHWLRNELRDWAESLIAETRLRNQGIFNPAPIRRAWREHLSKRYERHYHLWPVLVFQSWLEHENVFVRQHLN